MSKFSSIAKSVAKTEVKKGIKTISTEVAKSAIKSNNIIPDYSKEFWLGNYFIKVRVSPK